MSLDRCDVLDGLSVRHGSSLSLAGDQQTLNRPGLMPYSHYVVSRIAWWHSCRRLRPKV